MTLSPPAVTISREHYVICLDDDVDFLKSLEFFLPDEINASALNSTWYRFLFIGAPMEALGTLRDLVSTGNTVAMLITDQKMPEMKGIDFLEQARQISPDSMRVLLTGHAGIESAIAAINSNLLDKYVTKPIDNESDFTINIRQLLHAFHMKRRLERQTRALRDLYELSVALNTSEELEDTVRKVSEFTRRIIDCRRVDLRLDSADGGVSEGLSAAPADDPGVSLEVELFANERRLGRLVAIGLVDPGGPDEGLLETLDTLGRTAAIALQNQISRRALGIAYEETREQADALSRANARLELLDRLKNDFLSFISHELRTPLNCMAAIDLLDGLPESAAHAPLIQAIQSGYSRLHGFIENGLEYFDWLASRDAAVSDLDLVPIVEELAQQGVAASGRPIRLVLDLPSGPGITSFPADAARKVVETLVSNAVKFSSEHDPEVHVQLAGDGTGWMLRVSDNGCGFAPELAAEIFRPFTVVNTLNHSRGSALSLAKVDVALQAHGGRVAAESAGPGRGATFKAFFPPQAGLNGVGRAA